MESERNSRLGAKDENAENQWNEKRSAQNNASTTEDDNYTGINKDVSGKDLTEEERDRVRHHENFGNKHYESFSNHSSADDQPQTDTGA